MVVLAVVVAVNEGCGWSGGLVAPLGISIVGTFLAWSARSRSEYFGLVIRPQIWNSCEKMYKLEGMAWEELRSGLLRAGSIMLWRCIA